MVVESMGPDPDQTRDPLDLQSTLPTALRDR